MQRTFNYTERKRIKREHVQFEILESGPVPAFTVLLKLPVEEYPEDASIFIDAYCKETRQRFNFGTVKRIEPPESCALDQIDLSAPTQFKVSVVDESDRHGRIVASGEGFKPVGDEDNENKSSLLPVSSRPMGESVWEVDLDSGGKPVLCINNRIPDCISKIKSDPLFQALILPAAMREVLLRYLWGEENFEQDASFKHWMNFAEFMAGKRPESDEESALARWVDEAVEEFSKRFRMCELLCASLDKEAL